MKSKPKKSVVKKQKMKPFNNGGASYYKKLRKKYTDKEIAESFILPHNLTPAQMETEQVNHPSHYGGKENPYEAIKVIRAWDLSFSLGNTVKYISRAGKKGDGKKLEDLRKALWYLKEEIETLEKQNQ